MVHLVGRRAAILSYRLGMADGVSVTAAQWATALRRLGMHVTTVAGAGRADVLVDGLAIDAARPPAGDRLAAALGDADLVVVDNVCSLPMNPARRGGGGAPPRRSARRAAPPRRRRRGADRAVSADRAPTAGTRDARDRADSHLHEISDPGAHERRGRQLDRCRSTDGVAQRHDVYPGEPQQGKHQAGGRAGRTHRRLGARRPGDHGRVRGRHVACDLST